ncbi:discoidin domain-containing protein [Saccharopolyspora indica]|uniref:discoidin domain-containing protein n=1 Tax=Saccharopolyspora indica TaxID=1229659 RepID=UPI0022EA626B|nr:discoidin domain-containing protein [Saccharopolyspora indica]MDA3647710.1 discoidin domain-containing protein [Saccharopolyspora indica]
MGTEHSRRRVLQALGAGGLALAATALVLPPSSAQPRGAPDDVAATYWEVLLRHTRWVERQFDPTARIYPARDFTFAVVLGNAVLLTGEGYDATLAGVEREVLHRHTVDTIRHFAASNAIAGGTEWGRRLFFDTTFQSYFQLAGRLLWNDLDGATRANLDRIAIGQAVYTAGLGLGDDPLSGDWTPNGSAGGYAGDTKLEEMGVYAQALSPGIAWAPGDPRAAAWREWFGTWSRNETGLPAADLANPRPVDGAPISANTAENLHGTFLVENHGSFGPHYQEELWRTSGRNAMHFLLAGQPLPEVLTAQPNGERLWHTMLLMASDAGEPLMPMVADREHLYGRDVLPLAFRAQVLGDRFAARAEAQLAERLLPYQAYPPAERVTKFSGEPKYEPEARAEIAIGYLLHEWRADHGGPVRPVSQAEFNAHAVGVRDFGAEPGLLAHRTSSAWAASVSKPGYVKFAWQPHHDDWLFTVSGATPMLLPSTEFAARNRSAATWTKVRDGFDATAAVLEFDGGYAGFASLPSGAAVYATTGLAAGEGVVSVRNLDMPGVPGLNGERTYRTAEGAVTVPAAPGGERTDDVVFPAVTARHVRMLGVQPDPAYGYSVWSFEVRDSTGGTDLARAGTASAAPGREAQRAIDGDASTRWAVATADRPRADSWLAVDLGAAQRFDRVAIAWEAAAGRRYRIETSQDGITWTAVATHPRPAVSTGGGWLDVDGRAGFVVTGSPNPITVTGDQILLSDGRAAPLLVECHPDPRALAAAATAPRPASDVPAVRASAVDGHLVLLNLSGSAVRGTVALPGTGGVIPLHRGVQVITESGSELAISLAGAEGRVEPAWFTAGPDLPVGLRATVTDAATLQLTAPAGPPLRLRVQPAGEPPRHVVVPGGRTTTINARHTPPYPLDDLALGATTFPTEPLPAGMSAPSAAVDGDERTSWYPGSDGRMVVDLGTVHRIGEVELTWADGRRPTVTVETSTDGRTYAPAPPTSGTVLRSAVAARYVAVRARGGRAGLTRLGIRRATARSGEG